MRESVTSRTAVYGPVRTVVWQGSVGDRRPYADQRRFGTNPADHNSPTPIAFRSVGGGAIRTTDDVPVSRDLSLCDRSNERLDGFG
jgi:hypothetical protein